MSLKRLDASCGSESALFSDQLSNVDVYLCQPVQHFSNQSKVLKGGEILLRFVNFPDDLGELVLRLLAESHK